MGTKQERKGSTLNAFFWRENTPKTEPETVSPQLAYYHRKTAAGVHPRQIRRAGGEVLDQRFKANRTETKTLHSAN